MKEGVDAGTLPRRGDQRSQQFLAAALDRDCPGDAVLSEEPSTTGSA